MVFAVKLFFALAAAELVLAMDNLNVVYQWKSLDFEFGSEEERSIAIQNGSFIPENNIPMGLEVAGKRIFLTIPRWRPGVPASLAYISRDGERDSPKLTPYPNWEAHQRVVNGTNPEQLVSPFRMKADRCGNLWILDSGMAKILEPTAFRVKPPTILIFNLEDDLLVRRYEIPEAQFKKNSLFANIAVEDEDCSNIFAYLADISGPGLVVYSWKSNDSWLVTHNYFNIEPTAGEFNVAGINFQWSDGIFGLALSEVKPDGFCDLYFHPMTSTDEFVVSTKFLKDKALSQKSSAEFKHLGNRGQKGQSSVSFLDKKTGVLFYALVNLNAIACWKTSNPKYTMQSQGRVYMSNVTMVFPSDLKIDSEDNMWVLSNKLPIFMFSKLNLSDVNFRILMAPVKIAINGTACDAKVVVSPEMVVKMKNDLENIHNHLNTTNLPKLVPKSGSDSFHLNLSILLITMFLLYNYY